MELTNLHIGDDINTEALLAKLNLPGEPDPFFKSLGCPVCDFHHWDVREAENQVYCHRCETRVRVDADSGTDELAVQVVANDDSFDEPGVHNGWRRIPGQEAQATLRAYSADGEYYKPYEWDLVNADSDKEEWVPYDDSAYHTRNILNSEGYNRACMRTGCTNEAVKNISTNTPMRPTDRDDPGPVGDVPDPKPVCELCADEHNRNLALNEGPQSVNGFLATEKE